MSNLTHSEKMAAEKTVCILLIRGENPEGGSIYAYIAVRADKMEEFMEAQSSGEFYPEDYGVIIESGDGEPNDDVRQRMEADYGFDHQAMIDIPDAKDASELTEKIKHIAEEDSQTQAQPTHSEG